MGTRSPSRRCQLRSVGESIHPLAEWDLDNAAIPGAHEHGWYVGPSHRRCNRSHGAPPPRPSPPAPALAFFNPNAPAPPDADRAREARPQQTHLALAQADAKPPRLRCKARRWEARFFCWLRR